MGRALWISADLIREWRAAGRGGRLLPMTLLLSGPIALAVVDGLTARGAMGPAGAGLRFSMTMIAAGPALAAMSLLVDVVHPRILRGELVPLLAAPVSDREIVAGIVAPVIAAMLALPLITWPVGALCFRLASGAFPPAPLRDLSLHFLCFQTASVWAVACVTRAILSRGTQEQLLIRSAGGYAVLIVLDAGQLLLHHAGMGAARVALLAAGLAAGTAALARAGRLDRERLVLGGW